MNGHTFMSSRRWRAGAARHTLVAAVLLGAMLAACGASAPTYTLFGDTIPATTAFDDANAVELGVRFTADVSGSITAVRFYRGPGNNGAHPVSLWTASGTLLARARPAPGSRTPKGWNSVALAPAVTIQAGRTYVASYHAPSGHYAAENGYFSTHGQSVGPLHAPLSVTGAGNGVYRYGPGGFPNETFDDTNYWVDVVFRSGSIPTTTTTSTTAPPLTTTTAPSTTAPSTTAPPTTAPSTTAPPTTAPSTTAPSTTAPSTTVPVPPSSCAQGGSYLWNNLETCGWPGAGNTGHSSSAVLRNTSGRTIATDGAVISNERISGRLRIDAPNVTIRNSQITSTGGGTNGTGVIEVLPGASATIDHVTIDGGNNAHACIWHMGAAMTAIAVDCTRVNDGIFSWQDTGGTTQGNNFTIRDSYFHGLTEATGNGHVDGYQTEGARNGVIRHNTYDIPTDQTAAVSIWNGYKSSDNIVVDKNLMTGGGFTVYAEDYSPSEENPAGGFSVTNVTITDNRFSTRYFGCVGRWGVWYPRGAPTDGWSRSGNVVLESGQHIDNGNPTFNNSPCT